MEGSGMVGDESDVLMDSALAFIFQQDNALPHAFATSYRVA
jgi:hypothetical protein